MFELTFEPGEDVLAAPNADRTAVYLAPAAPPPPGDPCGLDNFVDVGVTTDDPPTHP